MSNLCRHKVSEITKEVYSGCEYGNMKYEN